MLDFKVTDKMDDPLNYNVNKEKDQRKVWSQLYFIINVKMENQEDHSKNVVKVCQCVREKIP
jgi:hypothetical protein